jgi:hypothetical protein
MSDGAEAGRGSSIRAGYDRWALVYDHDANPLLGLEEPIVRAALGDVRGGRRSIAGAGPGVTRCGWPPPGRR